ncbi:E3 ubiquitin-protein ligase Topors isoform X1 [Pyrus x bretschneideri]|uniref:E3 ubiquitin-protein ligase Topors isoform X1 n=1 Tax=Pyrus x bretschneideri TaxID=225117 RepID=UPI002030351C|nr:E3 ubiquitin-protein ligase Topors isoform X1 [Pyrus x bretschneideri]
MDFSLREPTRISGREKRLRTVILPAIRGQNCPICLVAVEARSAAVLSSCNHAYCVRCIRKWSNLRRKCPLCNADFDSWFSQISLSSRSFHKEHLPPLYRTSSARSFGLQHEEHPPRHVSSSERRRSRPMPWRRSFGRPGSVGPDTVAERKLQWRASSVYDRRLQAVPSASRNRLQVSVPINDGVKERILQRIEPWIRRELQALLGDGDPSIIVHVATSLFIASLENKDQVLPGQCDVRGDPLASLRPFLVDRTDVFWHELRCFAESPFNMETYDAVVEYKSLR